MKQEELIRLEIEKIEAIHDLATGIRKLDKDVVEASNGIVTAMNQLRIFLESSTSCFPDESSELEKYLDQHGGGDGFEIF